MDRSRPPSTHDDPDDGASLDPADEPRLSVGDAQQGKTRLLSRQCGTCIFKPGNVMHLTTGRLSDMVAQCHANGSFIVCHDTLPHGAHPHAEPAICRGFYDRYSTQALQVIGRLWGFAEVEPPGE